MGKNIQRIQFAFGVVYVAITVVFVVVVSGMFMNSTRATMEKNASDLIAADAHQIELNVDSYLDTVETVCSLLFSDENYYEYYDTDPTLSEYERIVAKDAITARIVDLGMMENFSDFGIVYTNDKNAGWISQTTSGMFPNGGIYDYFSGLITDSRREEGWATGVMGNTDRIYFVKRLNPNAVAVLSFYTNEFDRVFTVPDELSQLTVRMLDSNGVIIYSTDESEISSLLPEEISSLINDQTGISAMNSNYLATSNNLNNGWKVVTSISTSDLMQEQIHLRNTIIMLVIMGSFAVILVQLITIRKFNQSVNNVVNKLEDDASTDLMTGLLNKTSFRLQSEADLASDSDKKSKVFFVMDLDNFKQVNDQLGHKVGDEVIVTMGRLLGEVFSEKAVKVGRIGGDEFAVYCSFRNKNKERAEEWARYKTERVYLAFEKMFKDRIEQFNLSVSMGVLIEGEADSSYEDLYKRADSALYESKRNGKGKPTYVGVDGTKA